MDSLASQRGALTVRGVLITAALCSGVWYVATHRSSHDSRPQPATVPSDPGLHRPVSRHSSGSERPAVTPALAPTLAPTAPAVAEGAGASYSASYAANLKTIMASIQEGRDAEAEAQLKAFPEEVLANLRVRHYVAVLWNNLGVLQAKKRGTSAAAASFRAAVALHPGDATATVNLTHTLWELKHPSLTREFLENTIRIAPDDPLAHLALADLLYDRDDLSSAAVHLDQASQHIDTHPELRPLLDFVRAKVTRTSQAEQKYQARESSHFMVKFDGGEDYATWASVLDILEDAYREIGGRVGYYPTKPILVVLHTRERFHTVSGSPAWADGLFDPVLGRIQVPTQGALTEATWLSRILRHEFVHALLHQRMDGRGRAVPTWLNEGLAMQLAGDSWADLEQVGQGDLRLIPLNSLEGGWLTLPPPTVRLAYLEGNSATQFLMERFGMEKVREILGLLAAGQGIGPALHDRLFMSYEEFEHRWLEELNHRVSGGRL